MVEVIECSVLENYLVRLRTCTSIRYYYQNVFHTVWKFTFMKAWSLSEDILWTRKLTWHFSCSFSDTVVRIFFLSYWIIYQSTGRIQCLSSFMFGSTWIGNFYNYILTKKDYVVVKHYIGSCHVRRCGFCKRKIYHFYFSLLRSYFQSFCDILQLHILVTITINNVVKHHSHWSKIQWRFALTTLLNMVELKQ